MVVSTSGDFGGEDEDEDEEGREGALRRPRRVERGATGEANELARSGTTLSPRLRWILVIGMVVSTSGDFGGEDEDEEDKESD